MTDCKEVTACRACGGPLETVLDLGAQHLAGLFPAQGDPEPPAFPLELCRCAGACGLVQLRHTVSPGLMFNAGYGYRSGVTEMMRAHLTLMAQEALELLHDTARPLRILDIGGNDGALLDFFGKGNFRVSVDPSLRPGQRDVYWVRDLWPLPGRQLDDLFDLVFTVACFYDADDPVAFASAVRDNLADGGLWCLEVADVGAMWQRGDYSSIVHEHLCYYDLYGLNHVLLNAGLFLKSFSWNACNGGSLRVYATKERQPFFTGRAQALDWTDFARRTHAGADLLRHHLHRWQEEGLRVHLLAASTKINTVLQHAGVTPELVEAASDRDPRKAGRRTPGAGVPIITEEESRRLRPDVYVCGVAHFRDEVLAREQDFLARGGRVAFLFPKWEVVRAQG